MRRLLVTTALFGLALPLSGCSSSESATMPDIVGQQLDAALSDVERAGFGDEVEVLGGGMFGVVDESNWTVCVQEPTAGTAISDAPRVRVDRTCETEGTAGDSEAEESAPQSDKQSAAPEPEAEPTDTDGDGVDDQDDFRPEDPQIQARDDVDSDGDGVPDFKDDFPNKAKYSKDSDGDNVANEIDAFPKDAKYSKDRDGDGVADEKDDFPNDASRSKITLAQENAIGAARDYLEYSAFSRQGLIDQLSSEYGSGFEVPDATFAVNQLNVNWNQQAVRSAKEYLDFSSFSRQGLIDQLSSEYGSQFTVAEATYAVNKIGL